MKHVHLSITFITAYVCYVFILSVANGHQQNFLETPPSYLEVLPGQDVQLHCRVKNKRGKCGWLQDNILISQDVDKYKWAGDHSNDCTLLIKRVSLEFDDGSYICQVSRTNFNFMDGLTSLPTRLLVIVKPKSPIMQYEGGKPLDAVLTLKEGHQIIITCSSNYGNPPAFIKWFLGNEEIEPSIEQKNTSEVNKPKTWKAYSLLQLRGQRENHGLPIRCVATHPSSQSQASVESQLNIQYLPEVRIVSNPEISTTLVDLESVLDLKCLAEANPAAEIKWSKNQMPLNDVTIPSLMYNRTQINNGNVQISKLRFQPVKRQDAGIYSCQAVNIIGESAATHYELNVQYEPRMKTNGNVANNITKILVESVLLGSTVEPFECAEFDANPSAQYRWIHTRRKSAFTNKSSSRRLRLERITWSDQGEYRCMAFNTINGVRREKYSEQYYMLNVSGPPEIQAKPTSDHTSNHESVGWTGERVHRLKSRLCSQPPPKLVTWEWGSNQIRAGDHIHPKYEALPLEPIIENGMMTGCYWTKLEIKDLQKEDARMYTLLVKSDKGEDSLRIRLIVRDSTETRVIGAAVVVGLLLVLALIFAGVWSILRLRRRRYRQEVGEEGSIAADALYGNGASMGSQKSVNSPTHMKAKKSSLDSDQSAYDYAHVKQVHSISPEALKVRRAPVVLQSPTIV
ncbi:hemicentin-2-like [Odontomachus brunneus]|uniref:hemicentin-2-like n=1 Tax=Odontomachus brunneus TaxID=486640 RepID=UPI0013F218DB|nr:hemicentin-2-like [Odontomachus brunneus]